MFPSNLSSRPFFPGATPQQAIKGTAISESKAHSRMYLATGNVPSTPARRLIAQAE
jgi:hypothetical protein